MSDTNAPRAAHADLDELHIAIVKLVQHVRKILDPALTVLTRHPDRDLLQLISTIRDRAPELSPLLSDARCQLAPLRHEMSVAGGVFPSRHEQTIGIVSRFSEIAISLPTEELHLPPGNAQFWTHLVTDPRSFLLEPVLDGNLVQKWLALVQSQLEPLWVSRNSDYHLEHGSQGLAFEWRQAVERRAFLTQPVSQLRPEDQQALARKKPGRKPDKTKMRIQKHLENERAKGVPWKDLPAQIEKKFGRKLEISTLKSYLKQLKVGAK